MADRYAYEPFVGLFIMICWGIADLAEQIHLPVRIVQTAGAVIVIAAGLLCRHQVNYWQSDLTLWFHCLRVTQDNDLSEYGTGLALAKEGKTDEALPYYFRALSFAPTDPYINFSIGAYEHLHGRFALAIPYYQKTVSASGHPDLTRKAYFNMAGAYRSLGDVERARECERKAEKYKAKDPASY
jgi:tetratricopeptide (TPR) repeat protein